MTQSNTRRLLSLRQSIYRSYGYLAGASDHDVAVAGIRQGGDAARAGREIMAILSAGKAA